MSENTTNQSVQTKQVGSSPSIQLIELATVEILSIGHFLDFKTRIHFARSCKRILSDVQQPLAWKYVTISYTSTWLNRIKLLLAEVKLPSEARNRPAAFLQYVPVSLRFQYDLCANDDLEPLLALPRVTDIQIIPIFKYRSEPLDKEWFSNLFQRQNLHLSVTTLKLPELVVRLLTQELSLKMLEPFQQLMTLEFQEVTLTVDVLKTLANLPRLSHLILVGPGEMPPEEVGIVDWSVSEREELSAIQFGPDFHHLHLRHGRYGLLQRTLKICATLFTSQITRLTFEDGGMDSPCWIQIFEAYGSHLVQLDLIRIQMLPTLIPHLIHLRHLRTLVIDVGWIRVVHDLTSYGKRLLFPNLLNELPQLSIHFTGQSFLDTERIPSVELLNKLTPLMASYPGRIHFSSLFADQFRRAIENHSFFDTSRLD